MSSPTNSPALTLLTPKISIPKNDNTSNRFEVNINSNVGSIISEWQGFIVCHIAFD